MPADPIAEGRRRRAVQLRCEGKTFRQIGQELGCSEPRAWEIYQKGIAKRADRETADQMRELENERLDEMSRRAREVLVRRHVIVSQGKIVGRYVGIARDDDGEPVRDHDGKVIPLYEELEDDAPVLQALDRLLKIAERRAKLNGLDMPVRIEIENVSELDRQIEEELAALKANQTGPPVLSPETVG